MKTAIYIEDGIAQLIITPETDYEKKHIGLFQEGKVDAKIFHGSFYNCKGGWVRQSAYQEENPYPYYRHNEGRDCSIMIRIDTKKEGE